MGKILAIAEEATEKTEAAYLLEQKKLEGLVEKEKLLTSENVALKAKMSKLLSIAEEGAAKAEAAYLSEQKASLGMATEEKLLKEKNIALEAKIVKLLAIAEEATQSVEAEYKAEEQKMQGLLSASKGLENNLTISLNNEKVLVQENIALQAKIAELLAIAKKATQSVEAEHKAEEQKMQGLLSTKESLESNLTAELEKEKRLQATNNELAAKISELLAIAEEGTAKITVSVFSAKST
jgi:hypothetical protein